MTTRYLLYLDTSALIRLYANEPGRNTVQAEQAAADGIVAHEITYVEFRAGMAGRLRRKVLRKGDYTRALAAFEADWPTFAHVGVSPKLLTSAGDLAEKHGLKAYDAVHLAAAISVAPLGLRFLTFDQQLQRYAELEMPGKVCHV